jgi:hypothetical protein
MHKTSITVANNHEAEMHKASMTEDKNTSLRGRKII